MSKRATAVAVNMAPPASGADSVLSSLNHELTVRGLTPFASLGVREDGWGIEGVTSWHENDYFTIAELAVRDPQGNRVGRSMRCTANTANGGRGCILVVIVGDHIATVRQFRLATLITSGVSSGFTTELPRMFANAEAVTTILDGKLRRMGVDGAGLEDEAFAKEVRNVLGAELGQLMAQPNVVVDEIMPLGSISEWERSTHLIEVVLVRLSHPNLEALKQQDLGPAHMKIRLYPLLQLLRRREREAINMQDQATLAGLLLAWGHTKRHAVPLQPVETPVRYEHGTPPYPAFDGSYRRRLDAINARLLVLGHRPLHSLGLPAPGGEIIGIEDRPWASADAFDILRFGYRFTRGMEGKHHILTVKDDTYVSEEVLIPIVNGAELLTVRSHHLPFLTQQNPRRAWCNRMPLLRADARMSPNRTGRLLGESESCPQYDGAGWDIVQACIDGADVRRPRVAGLLYEDSGANAVARPMRLVELSMPAGLIQQLNQQAGRAAKLVSIPIAVAMQDPEAHGIRDQQALAALLTVAEEIGILP